MSPRVRSVHQHESLATAHLCECKPGGISTEAVIFGCFGSDTSTTEVRAARPCDRCRLGRHPERLPATPRSPASDFSHAFAMGHRTPPREVSLPAEHHQHGGDNDPHDPAKQQTAVEAETSTAISTATRLIPAQMPQANHSTQTVLGWISPRYICPCSCPPHVHVPLGRCRQHVRAETGRGQTGRQESSSPAMRYILLSLLLILTGCGANPASLGLTGGAAVAEPPSDPGATQNRHSRAPQTGTQYAPSMRRIPGRVSSGAITEARQPGFNALRPSSLITVIPRLVRGPHAAPCFAGPPDEPGMTVMRGRRRPLFGHAVTNSDQADSA